MNQQINLYGAEFRPETHTFESAFMFQAVGILLLALALISVFAHRGINGIERELEIVAVQEAAAHRRLENVRPLITSITGEQNWMEQLEEVTRTLAERQAVLNLLQGTALGNTSGFSAQLRALARQDVEGIWLTRISLSPVGNQTRIEGHALQPELIPLYVQDLTSEAAFEKQRFHRFQIDNPIDDGGNGVLAFSMDSQVLLALDTERGR